MSHADAVLDGFTLLNGYDGDGGGVRMTDGTLMNCIVTNCNGNYTGSELLRCNIYVLHG